ncbi:MAG: hypothetical protein RBS21_00375 [Corynebacterium sp.]|jgi:hypothetical protein|nr:hypothetical protein [Corynebacterium sp.]
MTTPQQLAALGGPDPVAASQAALEISEIGQQIPTDIDVAVFNKFCSKAFPCGNYISLKATLPRLKLPDAQISLMGDDPLAEVVIQCETVAVPVRISFSGGALRWSGWVNVAHDKIDAQGLGIVECQLVGFLTMLDRILAFPEPFLPIEIQPSEAILIGPAVTVIKTLVAENCLRLQLGLWELFNNLGSLDLDWRSWFGTLLIQPGISMGTLMQMVTTPICVTFTDPLTDTSPWIAIHGRMDTCWKLITQQLKDNGLYATMDLWLPGEPQPQGVLWELTTPTLVFNVRNYQGVTGPTGTVVDGAIIDLVDFTGSVLGGVLSPFLNPANEYVPPGSNIEIAPTFGVNFTPPWVVFNADVDDSGLIAVDIAHHAPLAWQIVLGGRSPQWLNDFLNATLEWLVDMLMMVIGITGIPNSILDGILDNAFLAFMLFENFDLRVALGPFGPPEKFFPAQSTYDIDALFSAVSAEWDIRGYPAAQVTFVNGTPFTLGRDLWPAQMASVIRRGVLMSDFLDEITIVDDAEVRGRVTGQVGDGRREEAPMTIFQRKLVEFEEDLNLLMLAPPNK